MEHVVSGILHLSAISLLTDPTTVAAGGAVVEVAGSCSDCVPTNPCNDLVCHDQLKVDGWALTVGKVVTSGLVY